MYHLHLVNAHLPNQTVVLCCVSLCVWVAECGCASVKARSVCVRERQHMRPDIVAPAILSALMAQRARQSTFGLSVKPRRCGSAIKI